MGRQTFFFLLLPLVCCLCNCASHGAINQGFSTTKFTVMRTDHRDYPYHMKWNSKFERMNAYYTSSLRRYHHVGNHMKQATVNSNKVSKKLKKDLSLEVPVHNVMYELGGYVLRVYVGTPAVQQYLYFDTSSAITWVQDKECSICFTQVSKPYSMVKSSTSKKILCKSKVCQSPQTSTSCSRNLCSFLQDYPIGTVASGLLTTDRFTFQEFRSKGNLSHAVVFGVTLRSQSFSSYVDGTAGFGPGNFSIPTQLASSLGRNSFSMCLVRFDLEDRTKLIMGPDSIRPSGISFTPMLFNPYNTFQPFYYLQITRITVGGRLANVPSSVFTFSKSHQLRGTIIDPGTYYIIFAQAAFDPVKRLLTSYMRHKTKLKRTDKGMDLSPCYNLSISSQLDLIKYFPKIVITFSNNVKLELLGYHYVGQTSDTEVCSVMLPGQEYSIIGGFALQNFLIVFDITGKRIGFKPVDCVSGKARS